MGKLIDWYVPLGRVLPFCSSDVFIWSMPNEAPKLQTVDDRFARIDDLLIKAIDAAG